MEDTNILGIRELLEWYEEMLSIDKAYDSKLKTSLKDIFMLSLSSMDEFIDKNFSQKANDIEDKLKIILEGRGNMPEDEFLNNLLQ